MLDTVRSFAIRWLLEPVANTVKMIIRKTDDNGNFLPGARLELSFNTNTNAGDAVVTGAADVIVYINETTSALSMETGTEPIVIENLIPGRYSLIERKKPNGYNWADSMGFVINADGSITPNSTSSETCIVTGNRFDVINEKIRGIRYVVCYVDNPTALKTSYDVEEFKESAGHMSVYAADQSEYISAEVQQWHTDTDHIRHVEAYGCMAVKIYDGDNYIGYYTLINAAKTKVYKGSAGIVTTPYFGTDNIGYNGLMPFPPGVTYSYGNTRAFWTSENDGAKKYNLLWPYFPSDTPPTLPSRGTFERYENTGIPYYKSESTRYYSAMEKRDPYNRNYYKAKGCPYEPKPGIGMDGNIVGDYVADANELITEIEYTIGNAYRYSGDMIRVGMDRIITETTKWANFRKMLKVGNDITFYDWEDRTEDIAQTNTGTQYTDIPLDVSAYTDYSEYDPENLSANGYVYYGDGMTAEIFAKYAGFFKTGSTTARQIVVEFEN